jgi:hypothetical protein
MTANSPAKKKKSAPKKKPANLCQFAFTDSRNCAMPRWNQHNKYCLFHAHQEQQLIASGELGDELAAFTGEFRTNTDLNHALGNLFQAVAQNRIPPRNAAVLAYLGQLLQQNIPRVQREIARIDGEAGLEKVLRRALDAHDGLRSAEEEPAATNAPPDARSVESQRELSLRVRSAGASYYPQIVGFNFHPNGTGGIYVPKPDPPSPTNSSSHPDGNRQ